MFSVKHCINQIGSWKVNPVCMYNSICVYIICIILNNRSSGNSYSEQVVLIFYTLLFWKILNCSQKWLHSLINIFEKKKYCIFFFKSYCFNMEQFQDFSLATLTNLMDKKLFYRNVSFLRLHFRKQPQILQPLMIPITNKINN